MIRRVLDRVQAKLMSADMLGLILLLVALQAFTYGIAASLRNADPHQAAYFFGVSSIALLIALGLNKLHLNGIGVAIAMAAIGLAGVWILGARLTYPLLGLGRAILALFPQIIPALRADPPLPIDITEVAASWRIIVEASGALSLRVHSWLSNMSDTLVRNMIWTLIMWLIAAWMGWFASRRNAITSLLPAIALLAAVASYSEAKIYTLWLMVSALLLLLGIWNYKEHTKQWERKKVDYSDSIRYDAGQAVVFLTIIIGAATFITPSVSWREIRDYLRERDQSSRNEAADLLGIQQQPKAAGQKAPTQKPSLPREHLLSGGSALSEDVVMTIRTGELPPIESPVIVASAPRYYWRSTTYDTYVGAGWITRGTRPQRYQKNTPLIPGLLTGYKALHLDVRMAQPEGKLFWSGILFSANVPMRADWRILPPSDLFADQSVLLQADLFAAASSAGSYTIESYVPRVTVDKLRSASTNYPDEIRKYYFQLPDSVPERVRELAQKITQGKENAYDKAKAIEAYLRTYPYDLNVSAPPPDQDVADYFLFDLKKGYCDYYATAMVVLARASGLPARFVSGYASGSYDAANAQYIVREKDAHSWAEVYFPEIGWVEFEPTASQPEVERTLAANDTNTAQPSESAAERLLMRFRLKKASYWLLPVLMILLAGVFYSLVIEYWWYMRLQPVVAIERLYRRLYRLGRPLAGERAQAETAYEFMRKLVASLDLLRVQEHSRFAKLFSTTRQDIEILTDMYQDALFGHNTTQKSEARKALHTWRRLRLRLWVARARTLLQKKLKASSLS